MSGRIQKRSGFTLLELILALSLLVFIVGVAITLLLSTNTIVSEQAVHMSNKQIGDACLDRIVSELRYADMLRVEGALPDTVEQGDEITYLSMDGNTPAAAGRLYTIIGGGAPKDVFGELFYGGYTVSFSVTPVAGAAKPSVTIEVFVLEAGENETPVAVYSNRETLALYNEPVLTVPDTPPAAIVLISRSPEIAADEAP